MSPLAIILIVLLVVVAFGGFGHRLGWYAGSPYYTWGFGVLGIVLVALLVLVLTGRL